jgi:hypothetical protein
VPAAVAAGASHVEPNRLPNYSMQNSPLPLTRASWLRRVFALAALSLLAGCASNGDFGEVRSTLVRDNIHDWLSVDATAGIPGSPSMFEVTDDERALRDLGYPLIEAPYDRQQPYSALGEYGAIGANHRAAFDRSAYANRLMSSRYRSPSARYAQITDDIRNDVTRIPAFFETAARVTDIDQKRRKSLAYVDALSPMERGNALRRIQENASIISLVRAKLAQRVAGYRFGLERLVIMTPSQEAVEVERSINQLQAQIARYNNRSAPTWAREHSLANAR